MTHIVGHNVAHVSLAVGQVRPFQASSMNFDVQNKRDSLPLSLCPSLSLPFCLCVSYIIIRCGYNCCWHFRIAVW